MNQQITNNAEARDKAQAAVVDMPVESTSLVEYQSRGKVLVIGGDEAMEFAPRLREMKLSPEVLLTSSSVEPGEVVVPLGGRSIDIKGYLGDFKITLGEKGKPNYELLTPDLVLDLSEKPLLTVVLKPPGYITADSRDELNLMNAFNELSGLTGTFEKPRYFDYDASICAHGRSGQVGCTACIDACPAQAISSLVESIEVEPYLCQGGGVCATVCPTGAIRYAYPGAADLGERVRKLLNVYHEQGGLKPVVAFISEADYQQVGEWPAQYLTVVVEELASVGMELWLSALAYGAANVTLISAESLPAGVAENLQQQLKTAWCLLEGFQLPLRVLRHLSVDNFSQEDLALMPDFPLAEFAGKNDKRRILFMAIDHLAKAAKNLATRITLPDSAPFGRIQVDDEACTLCMACTSVCPSKAVHAGNGEPKLIFIEGNCVQCGLCESACPENAIQLQARYLTDPELRRRSVVIKEDSPFLCVSCGKPFATQSMISTITLKLAGHAMFQTDRALMRLKMCEDCRVVDAVQDKEAMSAGLGQNDSIRQ